MSAAASGRFLGASSALRRWLPALALLVSVAMSAPGCRDPDPLQLRAADQLYAEGRWEEAASAYVGLPPEAGEWRPYGAWRAAAIYRDALRDPQRAEQAFEDCLRRFPEHEWGYTCQVELGDLRRDQGRPRAAIDAYRKALQIRPRGMYSEHCLLESGRAYLALGEPGQARVEWEELQREFPRSMLGPAVALEVARSFDLQGLQREALAAYKAVQKRYPEHSVSPLAAFGEAEALEQLGRLDEAEGVFMRVLEHHPNPQAVQIKLDAMKARNSRRAQDRTVVPDAAYH